MAFLSVRGVPIGTGRSTTSPGTTYREPVDLHAAVVSNDTDAVRALLASGAALSATDQDGYTPLELATDPDIARLLISAGAPVSTKGETTPLHQAVQHGWLDVAEMLL